MNNSSIDNVAKRITYEKETVDRGSGEVLKTYSEAILPKEPDYVKLYLESISKLNDLQGWTDPVLNELLKLMNYRNEIVLNSALKKRMAVELEISPRTIDNALSLLSKNGVILRKDTGLYLGNPHLFGKGEWRDIRELRMTVIFNKEGKKIDTEVIRNDDLAECQESSHAEKIETIALEKAGEKLVETAKEILGMNTLNSSILPIDPMKLLAFLNNPENQKAAPVAIMGIVGCFTGSAISLFQLTNFL